MLLQSSLGRKKSKDFFFFFFNTDKNIYIFLSDRELVSCYLISTLGNSLSCAYDFHGSKQVIIHVNLVLQNKLN